jgi:hypothetical protein
VAEVVADAAKGSDVWHGDSESEPRGVGPMSRGVRRRDAI